MKGYGQFCPIAKASEILTERWTPLVVRNLLGGCVHFNEIRRGVPLMSPSLLSKRLRQLEEAGVIECRTDEGGRTSYELTEAGRELGPIVRSMGEWGHRWVRSRLTRDELDAGLLVWDMRGKVRAQELPVGRTTVRFELTDVPPTRSRWWFVNEGEELDVCLEDPGHEVDLFVETDLRTLTAVWMGDTSVERALQDGTLRLFGRSALRRKFRAWLGLSAFARIRPGEPSR